MSDDITSENIKEHLEKTFPILYENVYCGISCPPGWIPIIIKLSEEISKLSVDARVSKIKEKFGTIRFYISDSTDEIDDLIKKAEKDCLSCCAYCGSKENVVGLSDTPPNKHGEATGWYLYKCQPCREKSGWTREIEKSYLEKIIKRRAAEEKSV